MTATTDALVHRQCSATRRSSKQRIDYFDGVCPCCGGESIYSRDLDRYLHLDGTGNRECWVAISRGESLKFAREAQRAFDDAVNRILADRRAS